MREYAIMNAIAKTGREPRVPYSIAYEDYATFEATDDEQAWRIARDLQRRHDEAYAGECAQVPGLIRRIAGTPDIMQAPTYVNALYDITDGTPRRIRPDTLEA